MLHALLTNILVMGALIITCCSIAMVIPYKPWAIPEAWMRWLYWTFPTVKRSPTEQYLSDGCTTRNLLREVLLFLR